jgi:hypothetical protein
MINTTARLVIFLTTTASRPTLWFTQVSPIQWVPGALSLTVKRQGREADHSHPSSAVVKSAWSYNSTPPIRLHGVVIRAQRLYLQHDIFKQNAPRVTNRDIKNSLLPTLQNISHRTSTKESPGSHLLSVCNTVIQLSEW